MKNFRVIALAALTLAAWPAWTQERAETQSFDGDVVPSTACADGLAGTECVIELRVDDLGKDSCLISLLDLNQLLVTFRSDFKDKFVYWRIKEQPAGKPYRFGLRDGIALVNDPRPRSFVALQRGAKEPTVFRARNKFNRVSVFKYVINVTNETEDAAPSRECSLDPWFRNR